VPALEHAELIGGSVYRTVGELCGMQLAHCEQTVEAVLSSEQENAIFGFTKPSPCLLIKRCSYARNGRMVEYVEGLFRGDLYVYRLQLKV
jgi:GntR family transcriptional regulator